MKKAILCLLLLGLITLEAQDGIRPDTAFTGWISDKPLNEKAGEATNLMLEGKPRASTRMEASEPFRLYLTTDVEWITYEGILLSENRRDPEAMAKY